MTRFRPLTHDPIRSQLASAIEIARLFGLLDALSGFGLSRGPRGAGAYDFSDDPLSAGGFGPDDQTIRVRPGPVRTTLIRPRPFRRMTDRDGRSFNDPTSHLAPYYDPAAWVQAFVQYFALQKSVDPFAPPGEKSFVYTFTRAMPPQRAMKLQEVIDIIGSEAMADGQTVSPEAIKGAIEAHVGPEPGPNIDEEDVGPFSISLMFQPTTWHLNKPSDPSSLQVQGSYKFNIASEKTPTGKDVLGLDFSLQAQAQVTYDTQQKKVVSTQLLSGGQLTLTEFKFLSEIIDMQEFVGLLDGVTFGDDPNKTNPSSLIRSKTVSSTVLATLQTAAGVQINLNLSKSLSLFIQAQGSLTDNKDSHQATLTLDGAVSVGVTVSF
jgi:hypothetical protein